ncbi:hypothetical protein AGMMS50256_14610 [Betaproteobacteria bacterium]|nr:hypothetical protein AGMMS50256_14610 [Betaproteobacteria bacterium]
MLDTYFPPPCAEGKGKFVNERRGKTSLPDRPYIKDVLLWFQSRIPLPLQKAQISRREADGIIVHEVDLDDDGIADFVCWDLTGIEGNLVRVVFVNIDGEWYPFEKNEQECTGG